MANVLNLKQVFVLNVFHLCLLILFISWPLIFLFIYTSQPEFILGDTNNFILNFSNGNGTEITQQNGSFQNKILSDKGRQTILWVSFLTSFLVALLFYLIFSLF